MNPGIAERVATDAALRDLFHAGNLRKVARDKIVVGAGGTPERLYLGMSGHAGHAARHTALDDRGRAGGTAPVARLPGNRHRVVSIGSFGSS